MARQQVVAVLAGVVVFVLIAGYGCGGRWEWLQFSVPQGYAAGILLYGALAPVRPDTGERTPLVNWLLWSTLVAMAAQQVAYVFGGQRGDVVVVIAWFFLILGLRIGATGPRLMRRTLRRLADRKVLGDGSPAVAESVEGDLLLSGKRWSLVGVVGVAGVLMATWPRAAEFVARWNTWEIGPAVADQVWVVVAGAVVGALLGRMIGYGRLARVLARRGVLLWLVADHPDRASGMKPVGVLYFYQSRVAGLPALFLAVWILVVVFFGNANPEIGRYRPFLYQYGWLLAVAIAFEVLVFLGPLFAVHRMMAERKAIVLLAKADRLSAAIEETRSRLIEAEDVADRESVEQRLDHRSRYRDQLENAPTWPIDQSIRRRFALRNLGFLLPLFTPALQRQIEQLITTVTTAAGP